MHSMTKAVLVWILLLRLIGIGMSFWRYDPPKGWADAKFYNESFEPSSTSDPYILESTSLPSNANFNPTVANGFLGHAIYSKTIYLNGLYNGQKGDCHRARIPGTLPYVVAKGIKLQHPSSLRTDFHIRFLYTMDMKVGTFAQMFKLTSPTGEVWCSIEQKFYAHRYLTRILVTTITVNCLPGISVTVPLKDSKGEESNDIIIEDSFHMFIGGHDFSASCGHIAMSEQAGMPELKVCYASPNFPSALSVRSLHDRHLFNFTYISSISSDRWDVEHFLYIAMEHIENGVLLEAHAKEWKKSWDYGNIDIKSGSAQFDSSVKSGLYYLLSAFPPLSFNEYPYEFFGASPGGLTNGGKGEYYFGHVFWDQDFWMLPALLPLFPEAVEHGLNYRIARLRPAMVKAKSFGFDGAFYPWESAYTGFDVCPGEKYIEYEQHLTGDIIHVLERYVYLTQNWQIMLEKVPCFPYSYNCFNTGWDMTYQAAKFWFSRFTFNSGTKLYEIHDVMGPDEYHVPVNNSAFTNVVAMQTLRFAVKAAKMLNLVLPEKEAFLHVSNNTFLPINVTLDYHPEYDTYEAYYDIVKQADTIMLGFPLAHNTSITTRGNDLKIYSYVTDPGGPAMTWSMFSVNFNEMGEFVKSDEYFLRQFDNIQYPFQIWSEASDGGGAVNFLTGIAGYIQSVLYGFLQLRIYDSYITLKPRLPPTLTDDRANEMVIHGLKIRNVSIDIIVERDIYSITLSEYKYCDTVLEVIADKHYYLRGTDGDEKISLPVSTSCRIL